MIGFEGRLDYGVIGTVANLASRLCGEAMAGQILVSPRVLAAVDGLVESELVGELALKGFSKPVRASNVVRLSADPSGGASPELPGGEAGAFREGGELQPRHARMRVVESHG